MANHYPPIESLSEAEVEQLRKLGDGELRIEVRYQFTDDQDQCMDVEINGVKLALQWISAYSAAAFYFTDDSPSARAEVLRVIRCEIAFREKHAEELGNGAG